jgi:hypothetical protein
MISTPTKPTFERETNKKKARKFEKCQKQRFCPFRYKGGGGTFKANL